MEKEVFVFEQTLNADIDSVWKALTDKDEMKHWFFELEEFKAEAGFEFRFTAGPEHKQYLHVCRVTEVESKNKLSFTWRYDGYEGDSLVTIEISEKDGLTELKLTHNGIDTFPESNKDFVRENFQRGWEHIIGKSLKEYLEEKK